MSPLKQSNNIAARMGRWSASHWKTAVFGWLAFVVAAVVFGMSIGTTFIDENDYNVGESRTADHIINEAGFSVDENGKSIEELSEIVLIQSETLTVKAPAFKAAIADAEQTLETFPQVTKLQSPLAADHSADLVSKDGHSAMIAFTPKGTYEDGVEYIDEITAAIDRVETRHDGFYIQSAGFSTEKAIDEEIMGGLAKAGLLSIPLTIMILLFVLRSLVAALIPLLLGLTSVAAASGLIAFSSKLAPASESIMEVVLLVGLAVGVDYSLFYIRREREERRAGRSETAALHAAASTSGRAVLVSGITVLIAMAGMFLAGDQGFTSFSIGTMIVVAVAMIGSLTVLPALLGRLGDKVEKGRIPFLGRRQTRSESRLWGAVLDRVLRHPVISVVAAGAVLLTLSVPTLSLHTTQTGIEGFTSPAIEPFERVAEAFPGSPSPAVVAIKADDIGAPEVQNAISELERQALATGRMNQPIDVETNPDGTVATVSIPLVGSGTDDESTAALTILRDDVLPSTIGAVDGVDYAVTGMTANSEDFNKALSSSMPKVFAFVLLFAFGLLLVSFRSIVIAVKAIVLNLLSVAAAYGVMIAFFQWGWGEGLLDFQSNGGIANWLPMFMFVILFGLSMDYHVFILSRIREAYDRGLSTDNAIAHGIKSTASVVTSAAVVMVGVFGVFTILPLIDLKEMGIGLAAAVIIDATIVRAVLLPASMKLLGKWNWYLPSWLGWLPKLEHDTAPAPARA
jgi:RND superfamily putative drug exporter